MSVFWVILYMHRYSLCIFVSWLRWQINMSLVSNFFFVSRTCFKRHPKALCWKIFFDWINLPCFSDSVSVWQHHHQKPKHLILLPNPWNGSRREANFKRLWLELPLMFLMCFALTLIGRGSWMLLECGGAESAHIF